MGGIYQAASEHYVLKVNELEAENRVICVSVPDTIAHVQGSSGVHASKGQSCLGSK